MSGVQCPPCWPLGTSEAGQLDIPPPAAAFAALGGGEPLAHGRGLVVASQTREDGERALAVFRRTLQGTRRLLRLLEVQLGARAQRHRLARVVVQFFP